MLYHDVWNVCYDVLIMSISLKYIAILNIQDFDHRWIFDRISKSDDANLLNNSDLTEEWRVL